MLSCLQPGIQGLGWVTSLYMKLALGLKLCGLQISPITHLQWGPAHEPTEREGGVGRTIKQCRSHKKEENIFSKHLFSENIFLLGNLWKCVHFGQLQHMSFCGQGHGSWDYRYCCGCGIGMSWKNKTWASLHFGYSNFDLWARHISFKRKFNCWIMLLVFSA